LCSLDCSLDCSEAIRPFVGLLRSNTHPLSPLRETREIVFVGLFIGLLQSHSPIHWFIAKPFPFAESPAGDSRNCVRWIVRWIVPKPFAHSLDCSETIHPFAESPAEDSRNCVWWFIAKFGVVVTLKFVYRRIYTLNAYLESP